MNRQTEGLMSVLFVVLISLVVSFLVTLVMLWAKGQ